MCPASALTIYEWSEIIAPQSKPASDDIIQIDWKAEIALNDLDPDEPIEISWPDKPTLRTTARKLMIGRGLPGFLTLDQVEFIFSD